MNTPSQSDDVNIKEMMKNYLMDIHNLTGAERILAYTSWSLLKDGYYSPEELINLSLHYNLRLDNPIVKIRRGTQIGENVTIKNGTFIEGERVRIGKNTVLDNAHIYGNNVNIGENNFISGVILPDNLSLGTGNEVRSLFGSNEGIIHIGDNNKITGVSIHNSSNQPLIIGNHNDLHQSLNLNCPYAQGGIRIGDYNSLGRDGGGVISTAYRFNRQWWGDVLIGSHVETTRGAEILGFSIIGWSFDEQEERKAQEIFVNGSLDEVQSFFTKLWHQDLEVHPIHKTIGLFGVVKVKKCCLTGTVRAKDGTRIQSSFLKNIIIPERSKVYFTAINYDSDNALQIALQDRAIENLTITAPIDWTKLSTEELTDGYREEDEIFYEDQK